MAIWIILTYAVGVIAASGAGVIAASGAGVIAASGAGALSGKSVPVAYVVTFAVIGLATAAVRVVERRATARAGAPGEVSVAPPER